MMDALFTRNWEKRTRQPNALTFPPSSLSIENSFPRTTFPLRSINSLSERIRGTRLLNSGRARSANARLR